ncbi:hypothetical protein FB645_002489 [Coemansia sp. IMI 203386]|nr:hypothetical protein FB645_002489 [Coemansia sp. IMI 203386]
MLVNPKHIFTEITKFRILVVMFKHYTLESNGISMLANPNSAAFQQLLGNVIVYQPDLKNLGDSLRSILESFVSNQNSRLFCALADLFEWYKAGMSYSILQLTTKHINSIFKRPPYEERPYTHELTYAQRLIMIYHVLNCEPWDALVEAYDSLYQALHSKQWPNKFKFLQAEGVGSTVAATSYRIIEECNKSVFTPHPISADTRVLGIFTPSSILTKEAIRDGRVTKRRSVSSISRPKSTRTTKVFEQSKPRSISMAVTGEEHNTELHGWSSNPAFPLVPGTSIGPSWVGQMPALLMPKTEQTDSNQTIASLTTQNTLFPLLGSNQNTQQSFGNTFYSTDALTSSFNSQADYIQSQQQPFPYSQEISLSMYHDATLFHQSPLGIYRSDTENLIRELGLSATPISSVDSSVNVSLMSLPVQSSEFSEIPAVANETLHALSEQLSNPGHIARNSIVTGGYVVQSCTPCSSQNTADAHGELSGSFAKPAAQSPDK